MADPLSTAASILTVIQLTDQVLTHCYAYIGMVKNAAAEIDNVIHVIGLLKGIFFNLHQLAIANPSSARLNDLIAAGGPLSVCSGVLKQLEAKLNTPSAKLTATRKLLWPFESKKLEGLLEKIRQQKPALLLSLATDNANFSYKIRDDVRQIQAGLDSARLEDKRERVLGWLRPSDSKEKHLTSRRLQEHGTNQWVLDNVKFQRWTQEPRQNIWLHGIPGCGKTIICSTVVEHLKGLIKDDTSHRLAYYYFDFNDTENLKLSCLLRSLIFQLCLGQADIPKGLNELYDESDRGRSNAADEDLSQILFEILNSDEMTYVVIDGLDECPVESERSKMESLLLTPIQEHNVNTNFLFSSRMEFDIEEAMKTLGNAIDLHVIKIAADDVDADVRIHVQRFISGHKRISKWSQAVRQEIENELLKGSQGMFRWVELQLHSIGKCVLPSAARNLLKQLPVTLYGSYNRILESVAPENIPAVRAALMFLAYSQRPLLVEELADAVLINVEDQIFDHEERSDDPLSILLELCSSLITITAASDADRGWLLERRWIQYQETSAHRIVRFSHFSVKEYIVSQHQQQTGLGMFSFGDVDAHKHISEALLIYIIVLGSSIPASRSMYESCTDSLRLYAAQYWAQHLRSVPQQLRRKESIQLLHALFDTTKPEAYMYWLRLYNPDQPKNDWDLKRSGLILSDFPPPVYMASLLGELQLWRWLIEHYFPIDDPSGRCRAGDPLQAAALGGHIEIVRGLLKLGAVVNTDHGRFGDPLQAAAYGGDLETVKLLLDSGAVINTNHGEYGNSLIAAACRGHVAIATLLLERGADPELISREHGKAIAGAAASGKLELVKLLLLERNDINDPNGTKGSALYCAAKCGDLPVVKSLIKAGADVNLVSGPMHTALHAACNGGHTQVVKLLLQSGADVNIFGGRFDSPLQACIDHGDAEIMDLLLAHGADMNHEGGLYNSPVYCATFRGTSHLAEVLLDRGAAFNDEIFLMAVKYEHYSLVTRMLKRGADVNAQNKDQTVLQAAIRARDTNTFNALLSSPDIDIDAQAGENGQTALHVALAGGYEEEAIKLLDRGASVSIKGGDYYNSLTAAVVGKNRHLIRIMLNAGADVNGHRGGWDEAALNCAAKGGMEDVVTLLLDHGADINEFSGRNEYKSTPLQTACGAERLQVAKLLISHGAEVNAPPGENGTALACVLGPKWGDTILDGDIEALIHHLLEEGADLSCPESNGACSGYHKGSTPLDSAIWFRRKETIDLFLSRGADICASSLRIAVSRGNEDIVRRYIAAGGDLSTIGATALCESIERGSESMTTLLLDTGLDVNSKKDSEYGHGCALGYAVNQTNYALVDKLLSLGADPSSYVGTFGPVLGQAIVWGANDIAKLLIEKGADVNAGTITMPTPLGQAASLGNEEMIKSLLAAGADTDGADDDGYPLQIACTRGKIHIVSVLLAAGANVHMQGGVPERALQKAAEWGHVDICKLLISKGANVNAQGGDEGNPLRAAVANMHTARSDSTASTVRYLLAAGADPNAPPSGVYVSTLAAAVANGHGEFIDALVEAGADVNAHDLALGTALISSARRSGSSRTYKLLDLGADPYLTGGRWGSAIHAAAQVGNPSVVKRLLDAGVSPNFVAGRYGPVLQAACNPQGDVDYLGCVRLLLARGADVNARGGKYETGLQCAAKHGKLDAVRELLEHGADPRIEGGKYGTAENAAKELKHWHVWNYLHRYARQNHSAA